MERKYNRVVKKHELLKKMGWAEIFEVISKNEPKVE